MSTRANVRALVASINGGAGYAADLSIRQESELIRTLGGSKPDPAWTHFDSAGHFHAFDSAGKLPTLITKPDEDEESDEDGYVPSHQECWVCGEQVEPNYLPDYGAMNGVRIPTTRSWSVTLHIGPGAVSEWGTGVTTAAEVWPLNEPLSVVIASEDRVMFGFAVKVSESSQFSGPDARTTKVQLEGCSELAERKP